jgi:cystathionine beta-lyase/cystathionine gamma-synthase
MKNISNIITHLGEERETYLQAVAPPIFQTSNFCFKSVAEMREQLQHENERPFYTRGYNPTVAMLQKKMAALEGTDSALIFASGSAAIAAGVMSVVKAGDHIVSIQKPYSWTNKLLNKLLANYGVETTMIDGRDVENFKNAIKSNTKLFVLESPNSQTFELQDLSAIAILAKQYGIQTICDNSYSTPLYQQPCLLGIDMVAHSASKYLSGHSDVVAGVLCASKASIQKIFESEFMTLGGIVSPNDAWLILRGLRTLPIRLKASDESAAKVVAFLEQHPKIEKVHYPFASKFPQLELAKKQMKGCGGLFSIEVKAKNLTDMELFCNALKYFLLACSWGGYESLQFPNCTLLTSQNYSSTTLPFNLVRLYVGLEDADLIIDDLGNALDKIG